jgi:hypothetical protein
MALNDIKVPKENAQGTFDEIALAASDLKLGTTANLPLKTGTNGVVEAGSFGTAAGSFCEGNDARLSDDRDPNLHAASHLPEGADEIFDQSLNTDDSPQFVGATFGSIGDGWEITSGGLQHSSGFAIDAEAGVIVGTTGNPIGLGSALSFVGVTSAATDASTTRTNLGAAASGSITTSGLTQATARILGRTTASTGAVEEIQIGSGLSLAGGELSSTVSAGIPATLLDAKGDLIVASAADTAARLAVGGTNGHVLTVDSAETLGVKWAAAAGGIGGGTGSTDNSILRSDGTGGSTLQASGLVIEDAVTAFTSVTGDAGTDIITATGSAFANGQRVRFTALTGGSGLNTTTNYFVINASGATFQLSTTDGGSASLFTTNITGATLLTGHAVQTLVRVSNVASDTNSALVVSPKGTGAFMLGPQPDGSATGGNARGAQSVDLQMNRSSATQVASGEYSFAVGRTSTASNTDSIAMGLNATSSAFGSVAIGRNNLASSNDYASCIGGAFNTASGESAICIGGRSTTASSAYSSALGIRAVANRYALLAHSAGFFAADGDAQSIRAVLRCKTTNATATELFLDGSATRLTIPSGKVMSGIINITGVKSDGATVAHYIRRFSVKNVAGTSSAVYTAETIGTDVAAGTSITFNNPDTNDALSISVTGIASETWRWVASVDAVEVAFGT